MEEKKEDPVDTGYFYRNAATPETNNASRRKLVLQDAVDPKDY